MQSSKVDVNNSDLPTTTISGMQGKLPDKRQDKTNYNAKAGTYKLSQISAGEMCSFLLAYTFC